MTPTAQMSCEPSTRMASCFSNASTTSGGAYVSVQCAGAGRPACPRGTPQLPYGCEATACKANLPHIRCAARGT